MRPFTPLLLAATLFCGCSHYHLGEGPGPSFATLYVAPAANKTLLAQSRAVVTTEIREAFEQDGRITLVDSPGAADATLEITLTDYHREVAANREDDTGLASKFTLFLTATCTLRDNRTGNTLFDKRKITVHRESYLDNGLGAVPFGMSNDQQQSEYNALPYLAQGLASSVTHAVLDVW